MIVIDRDTTLSRIDPRHSSIASRSDSFPRRAHAWRRLLKFRGKMERSSCRSFRGHMHAPVRGAIDEPITFF
jgi:hypothetical protein